MQPRGKYMVPCTATVPAGGGITDFFTRDMDHWSPLTGGDPSGGASNLELMCEVDINVYDQSGGGSYTSRSVWFRFTRDSGSPNTFHDLDKGSGGNGSVSFSTTESGLTVCKFQVNGVATDPTNPLVFVGMVHFEAHW